MPSLQQFIFHVLPIAYLSLEAISYNVLNQQSTNAINEFAEVEIKL